MSFKILFINNKSFKLTRSLGDIIFDVLLPLILFKGNLAIASDIFQKIYSSPKKYFIIFENKYFLKIHFTKLTSHFSHSVKV